jgi:hypothetical protein
VAASAASPVPYLSVHTGLLTGKVSGIIDVSGLVVPLNTSSTMACRSMPDANARRMLASSHGLAVVLKTM